MDRQVLKPVGNWEFMADPRLQQWLDSKKPVYVSITGLKPRGILSFLIFARHAIPSKIQADSSKGILSVEVKTMDGIHHTLSVWESKEQMLAYLRTGAHLKAMKVFRKIATGKTYGYASDRVPDWKEARALWELNGKES